MGHRYPLTGVFCLSGDGLNPKNASQAGELAAAKDRRMHYPDVPFIPGQSYRFHYPNFEELTDLRRMTFESLVNRSGQILIVGVDLNTGNEARWLPELMIGVEPYEPVLVPRRVYEVQHEGKSLRLFVDSVYPEVGGDDFKVTGRVNGRHFAAWLSEMTLGPNQPFGDHVSPQVQSGTDAPRGTLVGTGPHRTSADQQSGPPDHLLEMAVAK